MNTFMVTFVIYTDKNPLTNILTGSKLDAVSHCWVASLANYNFAFRHQSGKMNVDADPLSCNLTSSTGPHLNRGLLL